MGFTSWAADHDSTKTRRALQLGLGLIWLLDAALQFQPYMFTPEFETQVIEPSGAGSPSFVAGPVTFAAQLMLRNPVAFDALFASIQLAIGLGLLWRRIVRAALAVSIVWAMSIWWLGEGMGGIFTGDASPVTGAPGAAVIYALIAALAWPSRSGRHAKGLSVASQSPLGGPLARLVWLALWGSGAYLLLLPANRAPGALGGLIASGSNGEPGWLSAAKRAAAAAIGAHANIASVVLAVVFAEIALGILFPVMIRPALVTAIGVAAVIWVFGETIGQIFTGQATDPNSGPLLMLLALAYWPLAHPNHQPAVPRHPPAVRNKELIRPNDEVATLSRHRAPRYRDGCSEVAPPGARMACCDSNSP
jgi:hypothetical protein